MVFIQRRANPSTRKAQIRVRLSATPTLSRSDPDAALQLTLTLSRAPVGDSHGHDEDKRPLTFATHHSICEVTEPGEEGGIDIFARGGFGLLRSASGDRTQNISLGHFRTNDRWRSESDDLRERGIRFVTVPPAVGTTPNGPGSATTATTTTTVTHTLNWERIFQRADRSGRASREDLVPGEVFEIGINHGYMGTIWWCWGDLETDLRDKRLHRWYKSDFALAGERPDEDELARQGNWVLGEDPRFLDWVDVTEAEEGQGQKVRFQIVE